MSGPVDAVLAEITKPAVAGAPQTAAPGRWQGTLYRGGFGHQAVIESIRLIRVLEGPQRAIVATEYDDTSGQHWQYFYGAERTEERNWRLRGGAGGSGREPVGRSPWVNFGGWGWPRLLALAGSVHGPNVHRVVVLDADGHQAEDTVANGLALLLIDGPVAMPCRIELCNGEDRLLAVQDWPVHRQ